MNILGKIDVSEGRVVLNISSDFCRYYRNLIYKNFPNLIGGLEIPRYGAHVTIANSQYHKIDQRVANLFHGEFVVVDYNPQEMYLGGFKKGFVGFYFKVRSKRLRQIQKSVIKRFLTDTRDFHVTICTSKSRTK